MEVVVGADDTCSGGRGRVDGTHPRSQARAGQAGRRAGGLAGGWCRGAGCRLSAGRSVGRSGGQSVGRCKPAPGTFRRAVFLPTRTAPLRRGRGAGGPGGITPHHRTRTGSRGDPAAAAEQRPVQPYRHTGPVPVPAPSARRLRPGGIPQRMVHRACCAGGGRQPAGLRRHGPCPASLAGCRAEPPTRHLPRPPGARAGLVASQSLHRLPASPPASHHRPSRSSSQQRHLRRRHRRQPAPAQL